MHRLSSVFAIIVLLALTGCGSSTINPYTLKGGGTCVKLSAHPKPPYANIQVSHDSALAHSEPMLAENPNNPLNLVGGSKFFTDPAHYVFQIGTFASFDGGCTWSDGGVLPGFDPTHITSDISFAFGPNNDVYASVIDTDNQNFSDVAVAHSTDGGKTFGMPVQIATNQDGTIFNDKPWIAVNPQDGSVIVVWSYDHQEASCDQGNYGCPQELGFTRSTDGGKTFTPVSFGESTASFCTNPATNRDPTTNSCDAVLGATPAFLPDGTLAVCFSYVDLGAGSDADKGGMENPQLTHIPTKLVVVTSKDNGTSWNTAHLIATAADLKSPFPGQNYRNFVLPAFAADAKTGQLDVAWADSTDDNADVWFATSKDDGTTWSNRLHVNDDRLGVGVLAFQPQIAVAPNGVVSVAYFDTRNDPANHLIDEYLSQSNDHGATFSPDERVTTQSWNPSVDLPHDAGGSGFIGDYQGLAADNHFVHPFWNDTRTGKQEIFTAAIPSIQPKSGK